MARLPGGIDIQVRNDHQAVIKSKTGDILLVSRDGRVFTLQDGKYVPVQAGWHHGDVDVDDAGNVSVGKLRIAQGKGITFDGGTIDLVEHWIKFQNQNSAERNVHLGSRDDAKKPVTIDTGKQKITAQDDTVTTTTPLDQKWSFDFGSHSFDSKEL